jgi:hypothetical protein
MFTLKYAFTTALTVFTISVLYMGFFEGASHTVTSEAATSISYDSIASLENAWWDVSELARHAAENIQHELDQIDLEGAREQMTELGEEIFHAVSRINVTALEAWISNNTISTITKTWEDLRAVEWKDLPAELQQYIIEHPGEAALFVVDTLIFFAPGGFWGPLLRVLGFTRVGVRARKLSRTTGMCTMTRNY